MAEIALRTQLFDAFLGSQEGIHSIILPDLYSSGGSQNLYIDKYGRARSILGHEKLNASAITTNTGGSAVSVVGLFAYRSLAGGSDTRRLRAVVDDGTNEYEVWGSSNNGATWAFIKDLGSGSVGQLPDYAQMGDDAFLTDGVSVPQYDNGTTLANAGGTQSPTISSSAGSAGVLQGTYRWKLLSLKDGVRQLGSVASTSLALNSEQGSLTWTADSDSDVTGYELYRTTGTGLIYFFVVYIDGRTTNSYTDNAPELAILENRLMAEHGDPPPTGARLVETHQQRMWFGGTDAKPRQVWYSDIGDPDSVYDENRIDLTDGESIGDELKALAGAFGSSLVCFHERSVWLISGTGQVIGDIADWSITRTNARVGTVSSRAWQRVPAGAVYADQKGAFQTTGSTTLAYFTPFGDIRIFDGDNDLIISYPVIETLRDLNFSQRSKVISFSDPVRNEIGWIFPTESSATPNKSVVWNHAFGVWYVRTPQQFSSVLSTDFTAEGEVLLAGESSASVGGYLYKMWSGPTFDGTNIAVQWMTKTLYGVDDQGRPDMSTTKRWRWADLLTQNSSGVTFNVAWLNGNVPNAASALGSKNVSPAGQTLLSSNKSVVNSSDGSSIEAASESATIRIKLKDASVDYLHDEGMRLRISATSNQGQWAIEGLMMSWQPMPGLQRRMDA